MGLKPDLKTGVRHGVKHGLIPTCREIHQLVSEGMDRQLTVLERLRLRLHLAVCEACTRFDRQMRLLRQAMRRLHGGSGAPLPADEPTPP